MIPDYRRILWEGRWWLLATVLLFLVAGVLGYAVAAARPAMVAELVRQPLESIRGVGERVTGADSSIERTLIIFRNNVTSLAVIMAGGILLGSIPIFGTLVNGALVGVVLGLGAQVSPVAVSPRTLFLALAPHGLIELPALWIGAAWGMKLGLGWLTAAAGQRLRVLASNAAEAAQVFLLVAALLVVAAFIEGNITLAIVRSFGLS